MSKAKPQGFEISDGYNLLMLRTEEGDYNEVLSVLNGIKQLDVNAMNKKGYTALTLAVKNGFCEIVSLLISRGANVNARNNSGQSPLFLSCWCGYLDMVKLLLEHGAEINTTDQRGWSPLTIASYHGNLDIVETLIQNNADVTLKDCFGKRAIHRAKDPKIIKLLQAAEAKHGITSNISTEKEDKRIKVINFKTEPTLALPTSSPELKLGLTTSISDLLEKKQKFVSPAHRRTISPLLSYTTSPVAKPLKPVRPWQTGLKHKRSNQSFDLLQSPEIRSPARHSTTPIASEVTTGRAVTAKIMRTDTIQTRESVEIGDGGGSPLVRTTSKDKKESTEANLSPTLARTASKEKKEFEESFNMQMKLVSRKVHELVEQKIAFEVDKQVQEYQAKLKQGIENIVKAKLLQSFTELQDAFNAHLKLLLNKLGYGENVVKEAKFLIDKDTLVSKTALLKEDIVKTQGERDRKFTDSKLRRLEKEILNSRPNPGKSYYLGRAEFRSTSPSNNRTGIKSNKNSEQLSKGVNEAAESLLVFSKYEINDVVQNAGRKLHDNLIVEAGVTADAAEESLKTRMENTIKNKFSQLSEYITNAPLSPGDVEDKSFDSYIQNEIDCQVKANATANEENKVNEENRIEEVKEEEAITVVIRPSSPKVEKIRIPEKKYSFFKEKSDKIREILDSVKEEEDSVKEQQTTTELRESKLGGQLMLTDHNEDLVEQQEERVNRKNLSSRREQGRSLNLSPSPSESSGTLSAEFRLEGLKNYFGTKKESEPKFGGKTGYRASAPTSIVSTTRSQGPIIPMHTFGLAHSKPSTLQYDFDD